ncbi:MAG: leucyl/phenylalanyl-tRNA--protein transferase [Micavibrio sp.]|nr:leucyl/phenylalanyl-tRNA--protein transferase [Micavibrio sp.]
MEITTDTILNAYAQGYFPMAAEHDFQKIEWILPSIRGLLPIKDIHISKSLLRVLNKKVYRVTVDTAFQKVIDACAVTKEGREQTWINLKIRDWFIELHTQGFAHSIEVWKNDELVGGLYGLALGGVFCGESMFSTATNASKVALVHLAAILHKGGFVLLDAQFPNPHLEQFGAYEMAHDDYAVALNEALSVQADFYCGSSAETVSEGSDLLVSEFLQSRSQTS